MAAFIYWIMICILWRRIAKIIAYFTFNNIHDWGNQDHLLSNISPEGGKYHQDSNIVTTQSSALCITNAKQLANRLSLFKVDNYSEERKYTWFMANEYRAHDTTKIHNNAAKIYHRMKNEPWHHSVHLHCAKWHSSPHWPVAYRRVFWGTVRMLSPRKACTVQPKHGRFKFSLIGNSAIFFIPRPGFPRPVESLLRGILFPLVF